MRESFWDKLNSKDFSLKDFAIHWNWIMKSFSQFTERTPSFTISPQLKQIIHQVEYWIQENGYAIEKNYLWKYGGYPKAFYHTQLFELDNSIRRISKEFSASCLSELGKKNIF